MTHHHRSPDPSPSPTRAIARKLLTLILERLLPAGPVIIGIDDTIERRWGEKIAARGIYRDPVRSSHGHFVKASGLRWLSFMAMIPLPWTTRRWALPFLTILAPSQRYDDTKGRRHKTLTDWARQGALQVKRWLPNRLNCHRTKPAAHIPRPFISDCMPRGLVQSVKALSIGSTRPHWDCSGLGQCAIPPLSHQPGKVLRGEPISVRYLGIEIAEKIEV